jgi:predicted acetyltransferase
MLEFRRIKQEEAVDAEKIGVIAFNGRHDFSAAAPPDPMRPPFHWTWGAFENGKIVSATQDIPYMMRFDGGDAKMSGIGGVATLPEARRGGKIRGIFNALLADAYAGGVVFSCLAPFRHAFYRHFGYELCCVRMETRIDIKELAGLKSGGSHELILPGGDTAGLQAVHEKYISNLNHAIRRDYWPDNIAWRAFTERDPYNTGAFVYLWRDEAGVPRGYVKYQHAKVGGASEIHIRDLSFVDTEALYAQLALIGGLSSEIRELVWEAPSFIDQSDFVDIAWSARRRMVPKDMTRIVNVGAALDLMRKPEGEGRFVIETDDPIIPENGGRWQVEFWGGGCGVSKTDKSADLACDLPALAQLVTGYRTLANMRISSRQRVDVHGNEDLLNKVFTLRPQHLTENF